MPQERESVGVFVCFVCWPLDEAQSPVVGTDCQVSQCQGPLVQVMEAREAEPRGRGSTREACCSTASSGPIVNRQSSITNCNCSTFYWFHSLTLSNLPNFLPNPKEVMNGCIWRWLEQGTLKNRPHPRNSGRNGNLKRKLKGKRATGFPPIMRWNWQNRGSRVPQQRFVSNEGNRLQRIQDCIQETFWWDWGHLLLLG